MLEFHFDAFAGVIVVDHTLPNCKQEFTEGLTLLIEHAQQQQKKLIWLTLDISQAHYIEVATAKGFVFHNCLEQQLTLILRLVDSAYAPFKATHSVGAGAFVVNENQQLLVIKERISGAKGFKLPGGHVELGEKIEDAILREVYEETGVIATFDSILGFTSKFPYQFGKANIYFVCRLRPLNSKITIYDPTEIEAAKWIDIDEYLSDEENSLSNRQMIAAIRESEGHSKAEIDFSAYAAVQREAYFSQKE